MSNVHVEIAQMLEKQAMLQLETGSDDSYGQALYNGLHMAECLVAPERKQYKPLCLNDYRILQKQTRFLRDENNKKQQAPESPKQPAKEE